MHAVSDDIRTISGFGGFPASLTLPDTDPAVAGSTCLPPPLGGGGAGDGGDAKLEAMIEELLGTPARDRIRRGEWELRGVPEPMRDHATAEDILQDVFVKIHRKLPSLRANDRLEAWVWRIARNAIADHFRRMRPGELVP